MPLTARRQVKCSGRVEHSHSWRRQPQSCVPWPSLAGAPLNPNMGSVHFHTWSERGTNRPTTCDRESATPRLLAGDPSQGCGAAGIHFIGIVATAVPWTSLARPASIPPTLTRRGRPPGGSGLHPCESRWNDLTRSAAWSRRDANWSPLAARRPDQPRRDRAGQGSRRNPPRHLH
jgi:hypothetical protein